MEKEKLVKILQGYSANLIRHFTSYLKIGDIETAQIRVEPLFNKTLREILNEFETGPVYKLDQHVWCLHPLNSRRAEGVIIALKRNGIYTVQFPKGVEHDYTEKDLLKQNTLFTN